MEIKEKKKKVDHSSSVNCLSMLKLRIITSNPIVTITMRANPNQPRTIADEPTPLLTLPLPMSCAIVLAATDAVCCHRTETSTKTEATKISANATWDTGREGKGLTSFSEPSVSTSCHPGNVARRMKQKNARITATILEGERGLASSSQIRERRGVLQEIREDHRIFER